jgi:hypothetical protein
LARTRRRRPPAIRIGHVLLKAITALAPDLTGQVSELIATAQDDIASEQPRDRKYRDLIRAMISDKEPRLPHEQVLSRLAQVGHLTAVARDETETGLAGSDIAGLFAAPAAAWNEDDSTAGSSGSPAKLTLARHQAVAGTPATI